MAQPLQGPVTDYLELTGNTEAVNSVDLVARVEGFLQSIKVADGQDVKKGQLLYVIEPDTYKAKLDRSHGEVQMYQAQLVQAEADVKRQTALARKDFASQARLDQAIASRDEAKAGIVESKADVRLAELDLGYTRVTAPFDGRISAHEVDVGALVGASGPTTLATLVQLDPIHVTFNVDERTVLRIKQARQAEGGGAIDPQTTNIPVEIGLQTETGYPHHGRIDYIAPTLDTSSGTLEARAVVDNADHALLPGLFVRIRIPLKKRDAALQVPERVLGSDQGGSYLLLLGANDTVVQQPVETGPLVDGMRVIEKGLKADDQVIVDGLQRAIPGAKVTPERIKLTRPAAAGGS